MSAKISDQMAGSIFKNIVSCLRDPKPETTSLSFQDVDPDSAALLYTSLVHPSNNLEGVGFRFNYNSLLRRVHVVMPTKVHESAGAWINKESAKWDKQGLVPPSYEDEFDIYASPVYKNFVVPYSGSHKEPDTLIERRGHDQPRVVVESAWSESDRKLGQDALIWLRGMPNVQVVITVKFSKVMVNGAVRVKSVLKIRRRGGITSYAIFPAPNPPVPDPFLTVHDLYGPHPFAQRQLPLRLEKLRDVASDALRSMGFTPA